MRFENTNVALPAMKKKETGPRTVAYEKRNFTTKYYGILVRTDYVADTTTCDVYFTYGVDDGSSSASMTPRMSLSYQGGVYTDKYFTDRNIKNLPTMQYNGHTWYYYYFSEGSVVQSGNFTDKYINLTTPPSCFETYVRFFLDAQN